MKSKTNCSTVFTALAVFFYVISAAAAVCYPAPTYQAAAEKYSCTLRQPNWAAETFFQITFRHCLEEPTIHVFIRNFYGVDEINMDFSKRFSNWKTKSFTGKTSLIRFTFSTIKANPKYGVRKQIQVQVLFTAIFGRPNTEHLLTAVFPADDTSDCSWGSSLAIHDQIFLGGGICIGLLLIFTVAYFYLKHRNGHNTRRGPEKVAL